MQRNHLLPFRDAASVPGKALNLWLEVKNYILLIRTAALLEDAAQISHRTLACNHTEKLVSTELLSVSSMMPTHNTKEVP